MAVLALTVFESDLLYTVQEQNLFLHTPLFFEQHMVKAGGLLTWMGCYLTQYFYYPMLGAGLLCLLWAFLMWLMQHAFGLSRRWLPLLIVPVACLLIANTTLGYWIFFLKLRGFFYVATLGTIAATGLVWCYRCLPQKGGLPQLFIVFTACAGYPLFGFYALWAVALMVLLAGHTKRRYVSIATAVVSIAVVPLLCYHYLYHETNVVNIYWTALPVFAINGERYFAYNLPYIALVLSISLMAMRIDKALPFLQEEKRHRWTCRAILGVTLVGIVLFWYKDDNFHRELSMNRSIGHNDWQQVLATAKDVKEEPTRAICMMRNLALFRLGRQGDDMFSYPNGAKRPNAPFSVRLVHTYGKMLYLQYGLTNYCYRWCMEDGVEYGWTVEKLRLMTLCALTGNEKEVAQKYLSLLRKTDFHKDWAKQYAQLMMNPQRMATTPELAPILRMAQTDNYLTNDLTQAESFIIEFFSTTESNDPLIQEQALLAAIQSRNQQLFWQQFSRYMESHRGQRLPRHYQEAACLFGYLGNMDMSRTAFDPQVMRDYEELAVTMSRCHQQGIDIAQMGPYMSQHLRNTYYYDYYFNTYRYQEE